MSYRGKVLKSRIWRGGLFINHLLRLRYFRGHSVHSPFVYGIVRKVFIVKSLHNNTSPIYLALKGLGVSSKISDEICRLSRHIGARNFVVDSCKPCDLRIISLKYNDDDIRREVLEAKESGISIVILDPYKRKDLCDEILNSHNSTSIDRYSYILLLNNHLPKQHFRV